MIQKEGAILLSTVSTRVKALVRGWFRVDTHGVHTVSTGPDAVHIPVGSLRRSQQMIPASRLRSETLGVASCSRITRYGDLVDTGVTRQPVCSHLVLVLSRRCGAGRASQTAERGLLLNQ